MDERQQQIKEGAGLEESRLNTEFIDFVQRWGGPFLILCAVVMASWAGWNWWQKRQAQQIDDAFAQYEAQIAGGNPSPEALKAVALEFEGIGSVSSMARLDAADVYASSIRSGVKAGRTLNQDGSLASPDDAVTEEERGRLIDQATALYQQVFDKVSGTPGKALLAIRAAHGLAAMAESRGDIAAARGLYERVIQIAEANSYANHVSLAKERLAGLDGIATPIVMLTQSDLAVRPVPPEMLQPEFPVLDPEAGPAGPLVPGDLDQPTVNPFNPESGPGLPFPPSPFAPAPAGEPGTPPGSAPEPGSGSGSDPQPEPPAAPPAAEPGTEPETPPATPPVTPPGR